MVLTPEEAEEIDKEHERNRKVAWAISDLAKLIAETYIVSNMDQHIFFEELEACAGNEQDRLRREDPELDEILREFDKEDEENGL